MSERKELAATIEGALDRSHGIIAWAGPAQEDIADAILAAGYRKPRTITTAEELDALATNTAIIGTSHAPDKWPGSPYAKLAGGNWFDYGNGFAVGPDDIMLPATVTYEPSA